MTAQNHRVCPVELQIIMVIALFAVLYFASSLMLPFVISAFLALFCSPLVKQLAKLHVPRSISAMMIIISLSLLIAAGLSLLLTPASQWAERLPLLSEQLISEVDQASTAITDFKEDITPGNKDQVQSDDKAEEGDSIDSAIQSSALTLLSAMAQTTAMATIQIATIVVVTYFFLVYGDDLLRRVVKARISLTEKKEAVMLFETVRDEVSRYVLTISIINALLGLAVGLTMKALGVADPFLWGALAGLLNYAPYIGTLIMAAILSLVGFSEFISLGQILAVPVSFLILNFAEAQYITPTILGKRFNLNPLLVVMWMFLWGWMWGAAGILLAIPMLVCCKIIAIQTGVFGNWIKILEPDHGHIKQQEPHE